MRFLNKTTRLRGTIFWDFFMARVKFLWNPWIPCCEVGEGESCLKLLINSFCSYLNENENIGSANTATAPRCLVVQCVYDYVSVKICMWGRVCACAKITFDTIEWIVSPRVCVVCVCREAQGWMGTLGVKREESWDNKGAKRWNNPLIHEKIESTIARTWICARLRGSVKAFAFVGWRAKRRAPCIAPCRCWNMHDSSLLLQETRSIRVARRKQILTPIFQKKVLSKHVSENQKNLRRQTKNYQVRIRNTVQKILTSSLKNGSHSILLLNWILPEQTTMLIAVNSARTLQRGKQLKDKLKAKFTSSKQMYWYNDGSASL